MELLQRKLITYVHAVATALFNERITLGKHHRICRNFSPLYVCLKTSYLKQFFVLIGIRGYPIIQSPSKPGLS